MKLAIQFGVSTYTSSNEDWASAVAYAVEAELLRVDSAWAAETWGYDGATPLAYLAAKTTGYSSISVFYALIFDELRTFLQHTNKCVYLYRSGKSEFL